jgi:hypothetical protein
VKWNVELPQDSDSGASNYMAPRKAKDSAELPSTPRKAAKNKPTTKPMGMFLQDPALPHLYADYPCAIDKDYLVGTGSSRFKIRDTSFEGLPTFASLDWAKEDDLSFKRFAKEELIDNPYFHQVNTFAVVSSTLDLVEEEIGHPIYWKDGGPLEVRPHAFQGMNAFYVPNPPSLNFGFFSSPFRRQPVWTCLSHDVVAHELGHAILDSFRPYYFFSSDLDPAALHESFSDLLAMFAALQYPDVVKQLFKDTKGDMRHPSLLTRMAEEFGKGIAGASIPYLRSALEGATYLNAAKEPHARSSTWTAAIYEILERLVTISHPNGFSGKTGFTEFCEALVKASRWVKGMLLRSLHYTSPASVTMPMLAQLIYIADARVYPDDSKFRDIAKEVFQKWELWNEQFDLTAPDLGDVFEALQDADPRTLGMAVQEHANALRIPPLSEVRLLQPRLVTTTRQVDKVKQGKSEVIQEITEHYLEYIYELKQLTSDFQTGELIEFSVYGGGILVMDEDWNAVLLVTSPEILKADPPEGEGAVGAWRRARANFEQMHQGAIQKTIAARNEKRGLRDRPVVPGCPFIIQALEAGGYRLTRRCCNLQEHVKGIAFTQNGVAL